MRRTDELGHALIRRLRAAQVPMDLVTKFTKAKSATVGSWLVKGKPPRGHFLNRLQHLLAVLGIESPELDSVTPFGRYLGRLMAFGLISIAEAQDICNIGHEQAVFYTIRGERDPYAEKGPKKSLEDLAREYGERLAAAEADLKNEAARAGFDLTTAPAPVAPLSTPPPAGALPAGERHASTERFLLDAARTLGNLLPLVRYLASDSCTAEDRALLRELLGEEGIFDLSNLFNALCSERARRQGR